MSSSKRPFLEVVGSEFEEQFGKKYDDWSKNASNSAEPSIFDIDMPPADFKSIIPKPGFCVKAQTDDNTKIFINVCHSEEVPAPAESLDLNEILSTGSDEEALFRFPLSLGEVHKELDKSGNECNCYDVVINSKFYERVEKSNDLRDFIMTLACGGLERKYDINIDVATCNVLKRQYYGTMTPQYIKLKSKAINNLEFLDKDASNKFRVSTSADSIVKDGGMELDNIIMPVQNPIIPCSSEILDFKLFQSPGKGDPSLIIFQGLAKSGTDIKEFHIFVSDCNLTINGSGQKILVDIELPKTILPEFSSSNFFNSKLVVAMPVAVVK